MKMPINPFVKQENAQFLLKKQYELYFFGANIHKIVVFFTKFAAK